jgi:hypothetical protein
LRKKRIEPPHWITIRELTQAEPSEPWYTDGCNFWKFRAIHHKSGLDYVPDRGGFIADPTPDQSGFVASVLRSTRFAEWVAAQDGSSSEVFAADGNGYHLRASNNRSYGYTYMWAYWS